MSQPPYPSVYTPQSQQGYMQQPFNPQQPQQQYQPQQPQPHQYQPQKYQPQQYQPQSSHSPTPQPQSSHPPTPQPSYHPTPQRQFSFETANAPPSEDAAPVTPTDVSPIHGVGPTPAPTSPAPAPSPSPTTGRPQVPIPVSSTDFTTNSPQIVVPSTFHVLKYFIKNNANRSFLGHLQIAPTNHIAKVMCRCVAKINPSNPHVPPQPFDPKNPQPLHIILQDNTGTWVCQDPSVDSWCAPGDIIELYAHIYPANLAVSAEPVIYPVAMKVVVDMTVAQMTQQVQNMALATPPTPPNAQPAGFFELFDKHMDQCRIFYAQYCYSKEYIEKVLKHKLAFMLELENPYYIIPLNQQHFQSPTWISLEPTTRRVLMLKKFDITDRLVSRVVHVPQITQCPQTQTQVCSPHCAQLTIDDYTASPGYIVPTPLNIPVGVGDSGPIVGDPNAAKVSSLPSGPTRADPINILLDQTRYPGVPLPNQNHHGLPGQGAGAAQLFPGQAYPGQQVQAFPGQAYPGQQSQGYPGQAHPTHPTAPTAATPDTQPVPSATFTHFDPLRNTFAVVPPMGSVIKVITHISFPLYQGHPATRLDLGYQLLSPTYDMSHLQQHLTKAQYTPKVLSILYEDVTLLTGNLAYGTYYGHHVDTWRANSAVASSAKNIKPDWLNKPTIFVVDQRINKDFIDSHKERLLDVTFDTVDATSQWSCENLPLPPGAPAKTKDDWWVMKSALFKSRPLYEPGTIMTTTGFIQCHETSDFVTGFTVSDGSHQPREFIFGRNYQVLNHDIRFGSNRSLIPAPTIASAAGKDSKGHSIGINPTAQQQQLLVPSDAACLPLNLLTTAFDKMAKMSKPSKPAKSKLATSAETEDPGRGKIGTTSQNVTTPFTLHSGFRHGAVVKLYFEAKIDVLNPDPSKKGKTYHYNILAYEVLPCSSIYERDAYVNQNVIRSRQKIEQGGFVFLKSCIDDIKAFIKSKPEHDQKATQAGEYEFLDSLENDQSFFYDPEKSIPMHSHPLSRTSTPYCKYRALTSGVVFNDSSQFYHTNLADPSKKLKLLTATVQLQAINCGYDYAKSAHTTEISGLDFRDHSAYPTFDKTTGRIGRIEVGSPQWPADVQRGSIFQIYFYVSPDEKRMSLVGYTLLYRFPSMDPTSNQYFAACSAIEERAYAIYWDELIAMRTLKAICPDFKDSPTLPMLDFTSRY